MEALIRTDSIEEATAYLEAFLFGRELERLWIQGAAGTGKSFLARWAKQQNANGRRAAILDAHLPPEEQNVWVVFRRDDPPTALHDHCELVRIGRPEYERKRGVLKEWAADRGLTWRGPALDRLLHIQTDNLQLLRSIAERSARGALLPNGVIQETDILRGMAQVGFLDLPKIQ